MTRYLPSRALYCLLLACAWTAMAQGPKAAPSSLVFSYLINNATLPPAQTVQVTVPAGLSGSILTVSVVTPALPKPPTGWLTVTPDTGRAPMTLSVLVNPTNLGLGSYTGQITVTSPLAASNPAVINISLSITNPPSTISVTSPPAPYFTTPPPALAFTYTTGDQALGGGPYPTAATLNVATTGSESIQFNVTAAGTGSAAIPFRVAAPGQAPALSAPGFAIPGNFAPITVSLEPLTLDSLLPGPYAGTVSVVATNKVNGSATVAVSLQVSAGLPKVTSIWPSSVNAAPAVAPVIDVAGDNFFSTSVVSIIQDNSLVPMAGVSSTLISRKHLQATIPVAGLKPPIAGLLGGWSVVVTNPGQTPVSFPFQVTDGTQPAITAIVDSASYLPSAFQSGTGPDPVAGQPSVAPREIISIFGQNLGPTTPAIANPAPLDPATAPLLYPLVLADVQVAFSVVTSKGEKQVLAPLIMVSANQLNVVVPVEVSLSQPPGVVAITVFNGATATSPAIISVVPANPAIFTFGALGQGQAAVLNYVAATNSYSINSSKDAAVRGSTISIYATGMGDLAIPLADPKLPCVSPNANTSLGNGEVACQAIPLPNFALNVNVFIDGQLSVVSYAGTSPGSVGGLVQINAVVPPTAHTGPAIAITTSVGDKITSRRSQASVTMAVK